MSQLSAKAVHRSADAAMEAARAARQANRWPDELEAAEAAARLAPDRSDAWIMVASAAARLGLFDRAEAAQLKALDVASDPLLKDRLLVDRAWALANQRRYAEAAAIAREARPSLANDPISRNILGATLMTLGMGAEALPHLEFAVKALPDRPDVLFNLAVVLNSLGHAVEAEGVVEKILGFAPGYLPAYEFLGDLRAAKPEKNHVERLRSVRGRLGLGPETALIDFALFKQLDDLDRREEAWRVLERANQTKGAVKPWSVTDDEATAAAFRKLASTLPDKPAATEATPRPMFIVSLPRTGSTLTERIFSAHPKVRALGELEAFGRQLKKAVGLDPLPYVDARLGESGPIDWAEVGAGYRREVAGLAGAAEMVTDKMPLNWWYAPFVAAALPDASILHVRRRPMDALFGAYKVSFTDAFGWAYRFEDMAAHYGVYRRLTDHWRTIMGDRFIEVDYEALVSDPETVTRHMLAACGLEFDPACLKPHLSTGSVSTPSAGQVRQPMTTAKIGSWRRYAAELEPLRALLQRDGWVDADGDPVAG
jgi:hypothetical protein